MFGNLGMKLINVHVIIMQPYVDGFRYRFDMQASYSRGCSAWETCHAHGQREFMATTPLMSSARVIAVGRHVAAANGIVSGPIQTGTMLSLKKGYILPIEVNAFAIDAVREVRP